MWAKILFVYYCISSVTTQYQRLADHARSFYVSASRNIEAQNHQRFMHEESPHYETGYLMHEIIIRYKKMVQHTARLQSKKYELLNEDYYAALEPLQHVQKLYFELYHICNMVHEIPDKWSGHYVVGDNSLNMEAEKAKQLELQKTLQAIIDRKEEERKKRIKSMKKLLKKKQEKFAVDPNNKGQPAIPKKPVIPDKPDVSGIAKEPDYNEEPAIPGDTGHKPFKKPWTFDYGWEPDDFD